MSQESTKKEARKIGAGFRDDVDRRQLMDQPFVRQSIERGMADSEAGRVTENSEVRRRLGLDA